MRRDLVLVGRITGAHGIRGEVKLSSFTEDPPSIAAYSPLLTAGGSKIGIVRLRPAGNGFIAVLGGVTDRTAAEALKGAELFVPRDRLPEPEPGEAYVHDLIGMPVQLKDGARLGEIVGVDNYGAGDLIDVKIEGRKETVLIPFAGSYVVDVRETGVMVDLPEGFLDDPPSPAKGEGGER